MTHQTIPPRNDLRTAGSDETPFRAAVSSLVLRALTAAVLVGVIAPMVATALGIADLA